MPCDYWLPKGIGKPILNGASLQLAPFSFKPKNSDYRKIAIVAIEMTRLSLERRAAVGTLLAASCIGLFSQPNGERGRSKQRPYSRTILVKAPAGGGANQSLDSGREISLDIPPGI